MVEKLAHAPQEVRLWFLLSVLDALTTWAALSAGAAKEGNPLMVALGVTSPWSIALWKLALSWVPPLLLGYIGKTRLLWVANGALGLICFNNLALYLLGRLT